MALRHPWAACGEKARRQRPTANPCCYKHRKLRPPYHQTVGVVMDSTAEQGCH